MFLTKYKFNVIVLIIGMIPVTETIYTKHSHPYFTVLFISGLLYAGTLNSCSTDRLAVNSNWLARLLLTASFAVGCFIVKMFGYNVLFLFWFLLAQGEHELTGNEDPSVLNAYISYLPSRLAFKEGMWLINRSHIISRSDTLHLNPSN